MSILYHTALFFVQVSLYTCNKISTLNFIFITNIERNLICKRVNLISAKWRIWPVRGLIYKCKADEYNLQKVNFCRKACIRRISLESPRNVRCDLTWQLARKNVLARSVDWFVRSGDWRTPPGREIESEGRDRILLVICRGKANEIYNALNLWRLIKVWSSVAFRIICPGGKVDFHRIIFDSKCQWCCLPVLYKILFYSILLIQF